MHPGLDNRRNGTRVFAPTAMTGQTGARAMLGVAYNSQFGSGAVDQSFKRTLNVTS